MADERPYYGMNDYDWEDCSVDQYDNAKSRDPVDVIYQLLQTGQPFSGEKSKELELSHQGYSAPDKMEDKKPLVPTTPTTPVSKPPAPSQNDSTATNSLSSKSSRSLKHKCDTCSQVFDSRIALSIHVGRIHKSDGRDKSHQCPHCPKTFHNASYLSQHMRIHTGIKPYKCDMCAKPFTQLSHLQQHKRTHSGEKPYRCTQPGCTKAFSQLSNLQSHTRSHLPDGNVHKCTSCYKCYFDEKSLNAHLRTHMMNKRVRNYKCEECGKSYTQDTYLQNHINNKHRGGSLEKLPFTPRPLPSAQPTSIQAATSMICKVEEQGAVPCSGAASLPSPLLPHVHSAAQKSAGYSKDFRAEANYQRAASVSTHFPSSGRDCEGPQGSAFKPPPVRPVQSMEVTQSQQRAGSLASQSQQRTVSTGYDPINNNILGLVATQDAKPSDIERQQQDTDMLWRIRQNMAASIGTYNSFNSQIHQYMAQQGTAYPPSTYSAYMNTPLDSAYADKIGSYADKIGSYVDKLANGHTDMFDDDSANDDYFMIGGLREAYSI